MHYISMIHNGEPDKLTLELGFPESIIRSIPISSPSLLNWTKPSQPIPLHSELQRVDHFHVRPMYDCMYVPGRCACFISYLITSCRVAGFELPQCRTRTLVPVNAGTLAGSLHLYIYVCIYIYL